MKELYRSGKTDRSGGPASWAPSAPLSDGHFQTQTGRSTACPAARRVSTKLPSTKNNLPSPLENRYCQHLKARLPVFTPRSEKPEEVCIWQSAVEVSSTSRKPCLKQDFFPVWVCLSGPAHNLLSVATSFPHQGHLIFMALPGSHSFPCNDPPQPSELSSGLAEWPQREREARCLIWVLISLSQDSCTLYNWFNSLSLSVLHT